MGRWWTKMHEVEQKRVPFEKKAVNFEESTFEGFSAGIGNRDSMRDIIQPDAFNRSIRERVPAGKVKFLDQHSTRSTTKLWGKAIAAEVVEGPDADKAPEEPTHLLKTKFFVSRNEPDAQNALGKIQEQVLDALSIGFRVIEQSFDVDEDVDEELDDELAWMLGVADRLIDELAWWETSAVIWGANDAAVILPESVKSVMGFTGDRAVKAGEAEEDEVRRVLRAMKRMLHASQENPSAVKALGLCGKEFLGELEQASEFALGAPEAPSGTDRVVGHLFDEFKTCAVDIGGSDMAAVIDGKDDDEDDCGCGEAKAGDDADSEEKGDDVSAAVESALEGFRDEIRGDVKDMLEPVVSRVTALEVDGNTEEKDDPEGTEPDAPEAADPDDDAEPEGDQKDAPVAGDDGDPVDADQRQGEDQEVAGDDGSTEDADERFPTQDELDAHLADLEELEMDLLSDN